MTETWFSPATRGIVAANMSRALRRCANPLDATARAGLYVAVDAPPALIHQLDAEALANELARRRLVQQGALHHGEQTVG